MRTALAMVLTLALAAAACEGDEPRLSAYAEDVEALVSTMNARLDEIDAEAENTTDIELIRWYAGERAAVRNTFVAGLADVDPPDDMADMHATALEIMQRVADAESAMADRAQTMERATIEAIWATPEGMAARTYDAEAVALCKAAEEELDTTEERAELDGVPWVPEEIRAVVRVAFGCEAADR